MIGRLKKMLGIDGLKLELICADSLDMNASVVEGEIVMISKYEVVIEAIEVRFIEKYSRGRMGGKKTDEYNIGSLRTGFNLTLPANKLTTIPFKLPVDYLKSSMDRFGNRNFLFKGIAKSAKLIKGVRSQYRIEADAKVSGTGLKPFAKKDVKVV